MCIPDEPKTESVELKSFDRGQSGETTNDEESTLCQTKQKSNKFDKKISEEEDESNRPWHALVSYVDELTLGGRVNSKGQYTDGVRSFPGFGCKKPEKIPPDCFPQHCYQK